MPSLRGFVSRGAVAALAFAVTSGRPARAQGQPPVIVAFSINDAAAAAPRSQPLVLSHRVVGTRPTQYRVSTRADFAGAPWLSYAPDPRWNDVVQPGPSCTATSKGTQLRLFFQVRAVVGQELRVVDGQRQLVPAVVESNVLTDDICIMAASGG